jgi:hypothetical protein
MSVIELPNTAVIASYIDEMAAKWADVGIVASQIDAAVDADAPHFERAIVAAFRDRLKVYETAAPWNLYDLQEYGLRLAMLLRARGLNGVYEGDEYEATMDEFLDPIEADLIAKGFSAKVASDWCEDIAGHAGCVDVDLELALKIIQKMQGLPENYSKVMAAVDRALGLPVDEAAEPLTPTR